MNKNNTIRISRARLGNLNKLSLKYPQILTVFIFLCDQMDESNIARCSDQEIKEATNTSQPTLNKIINILKEQGFIDIKESELGNAYFINPDIASNC